MFIFLVVNFSYAQEKTFVSGLVSSEKNVVQGATIVIMGTNHKTETDSLGNFKLENIP